MQPQDLDVHSLREAIHQFTRPVTFGYTGNAELVIGWRKAIARCFRGNRRFKGNLWVVYQTAFNDTNNDLIIQPSVICLIVLQFIGKKWTFKFYSEAEGPYEYNCPLSYLDMAPETCLNWRHNVRRYARDHMRRKRRNAPLKFSL